MKTPILGILYGLENRVFPIPHCGTHRTEGNTCSGYWEMKVRNVQAHSRAKWGNGMIGSVRNGGQKKAFKHHFNGVNTNLCEKKGKDSRWQKMYSVLRVLVLSLLWF